MSTTRFNIWYMKSEWFRYGIMGGETTKLRETHHFLGYIELPGGQAQLETVFETMQAENWSPRGEARGLIAAKGLRHTSMSVGDVVIVNGKGWMVASMGFKELDESVIDVGDTTDLDGEQHKIKLP